MTPLISNATPDESGLMDHIEIEDVLVILLDLSVSSWYQLIPDPNNNFTSSIPLTISIMWGSICRFINAYSFGWPGMEITVIGVHERELITLFSGKAEIWDPLLATEVLKEKEKEKNIRNLSNIVQNPGRLDSSSHWQHAPMLAPALAKALMMINKHLCKNIGRKLSGRILIIDAADDAAYITQEALLASCLQSATSQKSIGVLSGQEVPRIIIDVCAIHSHYPAILETLSTKSGGIFLSFSRELLVDAKDSGIGSHTPVSVTKKEAANQLPSAFSDFLMLHYLQTTSIRNEIPFFNISIQNEKSQSVACACHHISTKGIVFLCPSCAIVYCTKSRTPAICKGCGLRFKRKPLKQQSLCDRIFSLKRVP